MLEKIYKSQAIILQLRDGILGNHIDDFATYFIKQGYSQKTFRSRFGLISNFSAWLNDQKINLGELNTQKISEFIQYRKRTTSQSTSYYTFTSSLIMSSN